MKVAWVTSWDRVCGIADYSKGIWPAVKTELESLGHTGFLVSIDEFGTRKGLAQHLEKLKPDLIHFQHEYGLYGGKNPPLYGFPSLIRKLRKALPQTKLVATAHTVLSESYRYPTEGRGWQKPFRVAANLSLLPYLNSQWNADTWGRLHGVIVHSKYQVKMIERSETPFIEVIPHYVIKRKFFAPSLDKNENILVFGFFSQDKGQDIVIDAFEHIQNKKAKLILAGGVRRKADSKYFLFCEKKIKNSKNSRRILITGFLKPEEIENQVEKSAFAVAPFRVTTGSGSLTQSLSRGLPVLASDLLLNQEINERVSGTLNFFKSEDPRDLALKLDELLNNFALRQSLHKRALDYAQKFSVENTAKAHVNFYLKLGQ